MVSRRFALACGPGVAPGFRSADDLPRSSESVVDQAYRSHVADLNEPSSGVAGASARREHDRRKANDERKIRERWGRLGGLAVALSEEKQSTRAWERGAVGEERLGALLETLLPRVGILHDRRIPGTRANIDHIVVTPGGVWVIDAKRYKGRPELKIEGGLLRPRTEKLTVAGRDKTTLVDGVLRQVSLVAAVSPATPVRGALCFVEADWPLIGGAFVTRGVTVLWPKRLAKQLADEIGEVDVAATTAELAMGFPPA